MQRQFLNPQLIDQIATVSKTPCYVYHEDLLREQAEKVLAFPHQFGLQVRYAMKANPNANILRLFYRQGIHIDASSEYEVIRAIDAGIKAKHIQLSGQQLPSDASFFNHYPVDFVATSLHQLEYYAKLGVSQTVGIRVNPGIGSGAFKKIDTGGPTSSFGIRHEYLDQAREIAERHNMMINKLHIHIGSENTPDARAEAAEQAIDLIKQFPDVQTLNMGGGFKIAIMPYEKTADIQAIGQAVKNKLEGFAQETGRKIKLEIEPGKYLVMNSCAMLAKVIDIVDTGEEGYTFLKLNTGMTELPRVSMYGIQQPIHIIKPNPSHLDAKNENVISSEQRESRDLKHNNTSHSGTEGNEGCPESNIDFRLHANDKEDYVVVGHCCESGDLLTCILYQCDDIEPISLPKANIDDYCVIQSCGAYNASMAMKNYNSYPEAAEVLVRSDGTIALMRERQAINSIWKNEIAVL